MPDPSASAHSLHRGVPAVIDLASDRLLTAVRRRRRRASVVIATSPPPLCAIARHCAA